MIRALGAVGARGGAAGAGRAGGARSALGGAAQVGFDIQGVQSLIGAVGQLGSTALKNANPLHQMAGAVTAAAGVFKKGMDLALEPLYAVVGAFGTMRDAVAGLGMATSEFVKMSDPMAVKMFSLAFNDATASIGRAIKPIHEFGTALTRGFGDVIFALSGPISRAFGAFLNPLTAAMPKLVDASAPLIRVGGQVADLVGAMGTAFHKMFSGGTSFDLLQTAFEAMESAITPLVGAATLFVDVMGEIARVLSKTAGDVARFLGFVPKPRTDEKVRDGSVGAAVTNAQVGSIENYVNRAFANAFSLGTGAGKPEERAATSLADIYTWLQSLPDKMWERIKQLPAEIARAILDNIPGGKAARAAAEGDFGGAARAFLPSAADLAKMFLPGPVAAPAAALGDKIGVAGRAAGRWVAEEVDKRKEAAARGDILGVITG